MSISNEKWHSRLEALSTLLMAIATVATAWSAYQSNVWSGVQEFELHKANTLQLEAGEQKSMVTQLKAVDANIFMSYVNAKVENNTGLAEFYHSRFPPRLRVAHDVWESYDPFNNPKAPPHPFAMKEYVVPQQAIADSLMREYKESFREASESNDFSNSFVLLTVIFASVLFFGGITSGISVLSTKRIVVLINSLLLLASVIYMFTFPLAPSI